ncbi:MAG: hypothetical protein V3U57_05020 [Robiginitomaculum sp.]
MSMRYTQTRRHKIGKAGWLFLMFMGVVLIVVLYSIKTRALAAKKQMSHLKHVLQQEQAETRLLKAEIAHLQSPVRLRKLAKEHLGLEVAKAKQVLTLEQAGQEIPSKKVSDEGGEGEQ